MSKEKTFFDSYADTWDDMRNEDPNILYQLLNLARIPSDADILDVGSGTGVLIPYLHEIVKNNGSVTAVDISDQMLKKAEEKFGSFQEVTFIAGDILEIPLQKESYDAVTCLNFFPHLGSHKEDFIKKAHTLLHQGGSLIIMHDIPRSNVNSIHGSCSEIKDHILPPAAAAANMLAISGYWQLTVRENDEMYFVKGIKK